MTVWAVVFGLLVGGIVWETLDSIQKDTLSTIFEDAVSETVGQRARETLIRFDHQVRSFSALVRLLANHRQLTEYPLVYAWPPTTGAPPREYHGDYPPWLPAVERWRPEVSPSHAILLDESAQIREVFFLDGKPLPQTLLDDPSVYLHDSIQDAFLTVLDDQPQLLAAEWIEDADGRVLGALMLLVPVDSRFLDEARSGTQEGVLTAILDGDSGLILASSNPDELDIDESVENFGTKFAATYQSFASYEGSALNLQFVTLVPRNYLRQITRGVAQLARRQRATAALVFIAVYSLLFLLVSQRLARALRRLAALSQRALGFTEPPRPGGNQLFVLEDWMRDYIRRVRDVREEMKARHATEIQASAALTDAIMEASLDAIITIDGQGRIIEFNRTAEHMFGHRRADTVDRDIQSLIIADASRERFTQLIARCQEEGSERIVDVRVEMTAMRDDGGFFPVEVAIKPIALQGRSLYTVYMHDISERRRQEQEIRTLAAFPSESPSPIMRVNRAGVITYANDASVPLLEYWGCRRAQTMPLNWRRRIQAVLDRSAPREIEIRTGEKFYSLLMAPIGELDYVNIYARDITDARVAEAEARQHQTELVHVCRLSTMGEMATGIAHELNQPLSAIVNYANGSRRRLELGQLAPETLGESLKQIASQATRAGEIIRRLRALVSRQPVQRRVVRINDLVREVLSFVDYEIRRFDIAVDVDLGVDLPKVRADLVQIEQVILNLVRNAVDAVRESPESERRIRVTTLRTGSATLAIRVEDRGPGLSPEVQARLFEPFFSTKTTGMGMGLVISQTIAEDHGGKITATPRPGGGAVFVLELPAVESQEIAIAL